MTLKNYSMNVVGKSMRSIGESSKRSASVDALCHKWAKSNEQQPCRSMPPTESEPSSIEQSPAMKVHFPIEQSKASFARSCLVRFDSSFHCELDSSGQKEHSVISPHFDILDRVSNRLRLIRSILSSAKFLLEDWIMDWFHMKIRSVDRSWTHWMHFSCIPQRLAPKR